MWRWTGFHMGLDLIVTYDKHCLSLKRNQPNSSSSGVVSASSNEHEAVMATHKKRSVAYRVAVASLNEQKQVRQRAELGNTL